MVQLRDDVVGLDAAILMAPRVWEASGHLATFTDPLVDCKSCKERFRADQLPASGACPNCGAKDSFTDARNFNLMFKTFVGPVEDDSSVAYLRPETAQGILVNFKNVQTTTRKKPPFGIAQIGKSFRNEITPGNFVFRTREFEQMEMEYFVPPEDATQWYEYWCQERFRWYTDLGIPEEMLRLRPHDPDELSHYSVGTSDVEFDYPWGWGELEGIANRTDYDLTQHGEFSGEDLSYFDQEHDRRYIPYVIEPAAGADRATLAFLLAAYHEDEAPTASGKVEKRTVLRLHPSLAPYQVAVLPLSKNEQLVPISDKVAADLRTALHDRRRPLRRDRPALPAPGRGGHPLLRDDRLRHAGGQRGYRARPRLDGPGPGLTRPARRSPGGTTPLVSDPTVRARGRATGERSGLPA